MAKSCSLIPALTRDLLNQGKSSGQMPEEKQWWLCLKRTRLCGNNLGPKLRILSQVLWGTAPPQDRSPCSPHSASPESLPADDGRIGTTWGNDRFSEYFWKSWFNFCLELSGHLWTWDSSSQVLGLPPMGRRGVAPRAG